MSSQNILDWLRQEINHREELFERDGKDGLVTTAAYNAGWVQALMAVEVRLKKERSTKRGIE